MPLTTTTPPRPLWVRAPHLCALGIMGLFFAVRLWMAGSGQLDLAQDEAQYWDWSRRLQLSYYSKGPLIAWLINIGTHIFGPTELGVRLFAGINNLATQGLLYYWLAVLLERPRLGLIALAVANTTPLFIVSGVLMTTDNPLLLCWVVGLVCLSTLGERPGARWPLPVLTLALALGILAKYTMLAFIPLALAYVWYLRSQGLVRTGTLQRLGLALAAGALLGLLPILIWNINNDFVSFRHVAKLAGLAPAAEGASKPFIQLNRFVEYFAAQLGLVLPWWMGLMLWQGWGSLEHTLLSWKKQPAGRSFIVHSKGQTPFVAQAPLHEAAVASSHRPQAQQTAKPTLRPLPPVLQGHSTASAHGRLLVLLTLGFWPLWAFFLLWSLHTRVYPNWSAMSYASGLIFAALGVERLLETRLATRAAHPAQISRTTGGREPARFHRQKAHTARTRWQRALPVWAVASLVICILIHGQQIFTSLVPLPQSINPTVRLKGWSGLGTHLETIRMAAPDPDKVFFFSDAYDVTAALAFYLPTQPFTYTADFGRRLSQYDLWPDPNGDTLAVARKHEAAEKAGTALPRSPSPKEGWTAVFVTRTPQQEPPAPLAAMFRDVGPAQAFTATHRGQQGRSFGYVVVHGFTGEWPRPSQGRY